MRYRPIRVYSDTSVYGGAFDDEFDRASQRFFEQVRQRRIGLVTSSLVQQELRDAPEEVRRLSDEMLALAELVLVTDEAEALAQAYLNAGVLAERSRNDALHVALATVAGCDALVSWNFRHLVNFFRAPLFTAVNTLHGYPSVGIVSPPEVLVDEDETKDL